MKTVVLIKSLVLLLPIFWSILIGPAELKVYLVVGILAVIELAQADLIRSLRLAWPIPLLVGVYLIGGWVAPATELEARTYGVTQALATVCYGVPAGLCLAFWNRKEPGAVLLAFGLFALALAAAAIALIQTVGVGNIIKLTSSSFVRANPDDQVIDFLWIFRSENVIIGIIPMTIFALASLPLLLLPGWKLEKSLLIIAAIAAGYANIMVVTRTTLVAAALTCLCIFTLLYIKRVIKRSRMVLVFLVFLVMIGSGVMVAGGSFFSRLLDPLTARLSEIQDDGRFAGWQESGVLIWDNPVGSGKVRPLSTYWAHNLFLDCGLTNGWLGIAAMVVLYGLMAHSMLRTIQTPGDLRQPLVLVLVSEFVAIFFIAMTQPPNASLLAFSYLCCCYCLGAKVEAARGNLRRKCATAGLAGGRPIRA